VVVRFVDIGGTADHHGFNIEKNHNAML